MLLALKLKVSRSRLIEILDKSPPSFEDGRERLEGQVLHPLFDDPRMVKESLNTSYMSDLINVWN
jgi:hypothetical protein